MIFYCINSTSILNQCQSTASIWTYYPCSFIISSTSSSSTSFSCLQATVHLSIDQCTNREVLFFWHFPFGNMTITLESEKRQAFFLHLSNLSLTKRKLIKNIYHLSNNRTNERQLLNNDKTEEIILSSDQYYQSSIKFETMNQILFDYGTFIQITILTNDENLSL
ncbi:hypothetical protein I4U23_010247 [Adineta vaga]|nr:hypothetical protein I4U23_010247 [Adineta vaga]